MAPGWTRPRPASCVHQSGQTVDLRFRAHHFLLGAHTLVPLLDKIGERLVVVTLSLNVISFRGPSCRRTRWARSTCQHPRGLSAWGAVAGVAAQARQYKSEHPSNR